MTNFMCEDSNINYKIRVEKQCTISNIDPKKNNKPDNTLSYALSTGQTVNKSKLSKTQYKILEALSSANDCDTDDDIDILTLRDLIHAKNRFGTSTDVFREIGIKEFRCDAKAGVANITANNGEVLRIEFGLNNKPAETKPVSTTPRTSPKTSVNKPKTTNKTNTPKQTEKQKSDTQTAKTKKSKQTTNKKNVDAFLIALGNRESCGNHKIMNKYGYVGLYQVGEEALHDVGVYYETKQMGINYKKNDWKGYISDRNKYGITCLSDFMHNPSKQKAVQIDFKKIHWKYLKNLNLTQYIGKTIKGVRITQSGLLAGAHLVGPGGVRDFLRSNGKNDVTDANGTPVSSYIKKFAGYDIKEITQA